METKVLIQYADSLWSKLICNEFGGRCIACGGPAEDAHHWKFGRSIRKYRWNLNNGVWMCREDHSHLDSWRYGSKFGSIVMMNCPEKWVWGENLPPLKVEPFGHYKIQCQYEFLKAEALRVGLLKGEPK